MQFYYATLFVMSLVNASMYVNMYRKRFNVYVTLIFSFVPIATFGYMVVHHATELNEAIIGVKLTYIAACFLNLFIVYAIFELSDINIRKVYRSLLFAVSMITFIPSLTIDSGTLFYKSIQTQMVNGYLVLNKEYGPLHTIYYIQVVAYILICFIVNGYTVRKKKNVSSRIIRLLLGCELTTSTLFFGGRLLAKDIDFIPLGYVLCEFGLLIIVRRIALCDVSGTVSDTIAMNGETGFVSFDEKFNYLASNNVARKIFPELNNLKVDTSAENNPEIKKEIITRIKAFISNENKSTFHKPYLDQIYQIKIDRIYDGKRHTGYILYMQDDTKSQKYISLLNQFNDKLRDEVAQKTENLMKMHNNLILGMATMVESRDNSTGGHIKRTSDVVNILVNEILNDKSSDGLKLAPDFAHNLIKAAPMHDLGKIAVDDEVLRKPGRYTEEEFNKMKIHAEKGAHIVHEILKDTDDVEFHHLAENVAHYHHERCDGSGYPEGLKGEEIPLEARIMAVADVYDALVSARVYKDAMSFEQADKIMKDSFGKHFDRQLQKYYESARPKLETYYSSLTHA